VCADVGVRRVRSQRNLIRTWNARVFYGLRARCDAMRDSFLQFRKRLAGPSAGMKNVHRLARHAKIHRSKGELRAASALQKNHRVIVGNRQMLAQAGLSRSVDAFKFGRAMAHLHYRHARTAPVEQLFADAFENGERQSAGSGVEIVNTMQGSCSSTW